VARKPSTVTPEQAEEIERGRSRAYNRAVKRLRAEYPSRWEEIVADEYAAEGLEYRRRLTPKEKAAEQIKALLAEFPDLADEV
jgi:hypothetical protein